ncbi:MAG: LD-carboxypeptidase [Siphonobacter sp.]
MNSSSILRPPYLKAGDTVGLLALASKFDYDHVIPPAIEVLKNWGLNVIEGESLKGDWNTFAGTDIMRLKDYQTFLDNPEIKAIISARGGYGSSRILESVDYSGFKKNPKWVVGFSDITAVLCDLYNQGYESLHATMPKLFFQDSTGYSLESLRKCLFGEAMIYVTSPNSQNRLGNASGKLVGGNLCLFTHVIGSKAEVDTTGKILFIEETDEYHYSIDRYMVQLRRAGKLANLAGLIVGSFSDLHDTPQDFGKTTNEIVQYWVRDYAFPVAYGFPVGHEAGNLAMLVGRDVQLQVGQDDVKVTFAP